LYRHAADFVNSVQIAMEHALKRREAGPQENSSGAGRSANLKSIDTFRTRGTTAAARGSISHMQSTRFPMGCPLSTSTRPFGRGTCRTKVPISASQNTWNERSRKRCPQPSAARGGVSGWPVSSSMRAGLA
jgi:hypothetical protein